ncbi:MAG: hypothetical protein G01um101438_227 [Parcubacteria group bacterium Gr01-1014_38]|nr:MAG: hypothetical protein G01um101438_227 [Parcubacteria group bacterium Gr01-1014_38]
MAELGFEFNENWQAWCLVCRKSLERPYRTNDALCTTCMNRYRSHEFFSPIAEAELASSFVTIIPEAKDIPEVLLQYGCRDLLLRSRGRLKEPRDALKELFQAKLHVPCGQPALFEMEHLARFSGLGGTWVLDMSPYTWSGTHKDLRSWAVLSQAIEHDVQHLALWTAGNAGLSLAKLVKRWNATVPPKKRKTVYCLVDASTPLDMRMELRGPYCRVTSISTGAGAILSREQLYNVVAAMAGERIEREGHWQVTDGWDGVGIFMYSLLAQQCLTFLRDELGKTGKASAKVYIILPLGTGNILFGFIRGMERLGAERAKIVAAVPYGDHMMRPFLPPPKEERKNGPRMSRAPSLAPKMTGFYSPLSPCLWHLTEEKGFENPSPVEIIEVDRAAQLEVAARVSGPDDTKIIDAEPSALIAFGALKELAQLIRTHGKEGDLHNSVALVVNSGRGIMNAEEKAFYETGILASR